MPERLTTVI